MPIPAEPIPIGTSAVRGSRSAPLAIVEYADFECPSCAQFARATEPALISDYVDKGRVLFAFKHFPLSIHPNAPAAARAAWCADQQKAFWSFSDQLFRIRGELKDPDLEAAAGIAGLDLPRFQACRSSEAAVQQVRFDREEGERLAVPGTPTFFIGRLTRDGKVKVTDTVVGSKSIADLRKILDRLLGD